MVEILYVDRLVDSVRIDYELFGAIATLHVGATALLFSTAAPNV
jgi:hypothetical protein